MLSTRVIATALVAIMLAPVPARADILLIPFFGVNFGGDSGNEISEAFDSSQFNWGGSIAFMGGGIFGIEGDFGYSPDFFGKTDVGGSSVLTATGNLIIGIPFGGQQGFGVRPYGVVGAGLLQSKSDFDSDIVDRREQSDVERRRRRAAVLRDARRPPFRPALLSDVLRSGDPRHPDRPVAREGRFHERLAGFRAEVLTFTKRDRACERLAPAGWFRYFLGSVP